MRLVRHDQERACPLSNLITHFNGLTFLLEELQEPANFVDHGIHSAYCGSQDFSPNLGLPARNPFGFPTRPSPFVAHFYPMVNSNGPVPPLLTPDSSFATSNPTSVLASVAARRTDLLYSEFYKNLLRTATKSHTFKQVAGKEITETSISQSNKTPRGFEEKSSSERKEIISGPRLVAGFDSYAHQNQHQIRSLYEGLYNRLTPSDYLLRLRVQNAYGIQSLPADDFTNPSITWQTASRCHGPVPFSQPSNFLQTPPPRKLHTFPAMAFAVAAKHRNSSSLERKNIPETSSKNVSPVMSTSTSRFQHLERPDSSPTGNISPIFVTKESASPALSHDSSVSSERLKRKRRCASSTETCPVCGVTVRDSEMKQHFASEVAKLGKIAQEVYRNSKRTTAVRKSAGSLSFRASDSAIQATTNSKKHEEVDDKRDSSSKENRIKTFQKVCGNRMDRLNSKADQCRDSLWRSGTFSNNSLKMNGIWQNYNRNRFDGVQCPMCNVSLSHMSSHDQISDHVMKCAGPENQKLGVQREGTREQEEVDLEAGDGAFEEYEWCGQTRIRATALAHRELLANASGFHVITNAENEDSDEDLNVEIDETREFGGVQFTDGDLIAPRLSDEEDLSFHARESRSPGNIPDESIPGASYIHCPPSSSSAPSGNLVSQSPSVVVQALRMKIQDLEGSTKSSHCLICMESYKNPLVSIQCWHVHCERCWLRALREKKLCPQCNMITPASHLRKIYL